MDFANFREQLIGIEFGEAIAGVNPGYQFGEGDAHRVIDGTIDARGHDFFFVFESWPASVFPLHEIELQSGLHGNFDGTARNFAVTHGGVTIAKIKERSGHVHGQIECVSRGDLRRIHVAAEFRGHDGAARFSVGGSDTDAPKKWMERNFHLVVGIEGLKRSGAARVVDRVKPDFLRQRFFFEHRRIMRGVYRSEAWRKRAYTLLAIDLQIEDMNNQRVAGFRIFNIEGTGERVISSNEGKRVARLLERVTEAIQGIRVENVAGFQPGHGGRDTEDVFHCVKGGVILDDF